MCRKSLAQVFAFVPYQLIIAVTLVVFPFVSKAAKVGDHESTKRYVNNALRFSLLVLLAIAAPTAGAASGVIGLVFPEPYVVASGALEILAFGMVAFALFVISATVLTGSGRPGLAAMSGGVAMFAVIVATRSMILATADGDDVLVATASGTTLGTCVALVVVAVVVYRQFGTFMPLWSVVRGVVAAIAAWLVAHSIPHESAVMALVALASGLVVYLVSLVVLRELGRSELEALKAVVARRSRSSS